ncbi:ComEC/Rec2 family competence protein [Thermobispora bispora]|uniref:ComEC/Rec2 family competence protein n=1 Tax=Thermobispora bispora TaxID=2006 RepID=UPI00197E7D14|nr:ComEC/Rec2 family competence protein [Thermobispora bispora]QSI47752.1 ComEC/Rec2 family competence protein [Thermobispora bispora]
MTASQTAPLAVSQRVPLAASPAALPAASSVLVPAASLAVPLAGPAVSSWLTALVLLGSPPAAGAAVAVAAAAAAAMIAAWLVPRRRRRAPARAARPRPSQHGPTGTGRAVATRPASAVPPCPRDVPGDPAPVARAALAVLAAIAATAAVTAARVGAVRSGPVAELAAAEATVTAEVVLTDDPRIRPARTGAFLRERAAVHGRMVSVSSPAERVRTGVPVLLLGSGPGWAGLLPSQRIKVHGRLVPAEPGELLAAVMLVRGPPEPVTGPSPVQRVAAALRAGLREACDVLPPEQRGLLPALVVGDVSRMDEQVAQDMRTAGLSHLTAVSGANLSIVAGVTLLIARAAGLPLPARALAAAAAMIAFAVVARPSPSVLRALAMGLVAALALGTGRVRDGVTALCAAVFGLILFDPGLAREYGFALSVCATAGILLLAPRWRDRLARRLPPFAAEAIAVPAAAQAGVTPVLVLMAGGLEPVAIPANLLADPAVAPATVLGFTAAAVAPVSMPLAQLVVRPAGLAVGWIIAVAERAAAVPFATIAWPGGPPGLALLAVAALLAWAVLRRRVLRRIAIALAAGALLAVLAVRPVAAPWPPPGWLLVACDVGQGDAVVLSAGPGAGVVVDTGPDPARAGRCLRDLGIRRVPLVVLTHPHLDHVGGLAGVLRGRSVGAVVVGPGRPARSEAGRVSRELRAHRIPEWVVPPGTRWRFGATEITVLAPAAGPVRAGPGEEAAVNNASVVLLARWLGTAGEPLGSALLTGDIETEAQAELLRRGVPAVDVLKVAHHGSYRQDPAFLAATRARVALISVGAENGYGHPAPGTLLRLRLLGMRVYRTDVGGDIAVTASGGRLAVVARGRAPR